MKKKIKKILSKKITIENTIKITVGVLIIFIIIMLFILSPSNVYSYVDMDNKYGEANKCYKYKGELVCDVQKKVKQYHIK